MSDAPPHIATPSVFSPLAKALLDGFSEGVVVFDAHGKVLYANQPARDALTALDLQTGTDDLLRALGARRSLRPLRVGNLEVRGGDVHGMAGPATSPSEERMPS
jgi:PAS domain-containing protein